LLFRDLLSEQGKKKGKEKRDFKFRKQKEEFHNFLEEFKDWRVENSKEFLR